MSLPADDPRSHFEKAISEGAYTRAMLYAEYMEESFKVENSWYLSVWLGVVYMHMGQPRRALPLLERAVELVSDKRQGPSWNKLGECKRALGDLEGAEHCYRKYLEWDPEDAGRHIILGSFLLRKGEIEEAYYHFKRALMCPSGLEDEAYLNLAMYHIYKGNAEEACELLRKAIEIDPDYKLAKTMLAELEG